MSRRRAAFTLLELIVSLAIAAVLVGLLLAAVQSVPHAALRSACRNNVRQLALSLHSFHNVQGYLPPATSYSPEPFLNWSARLLPYLEQPHLWDRTVRAFGESRDFTVNPPHVGLETVVPLFVCPSDGRPVAVVTPENVRVALTNYLGVSGGDRRDGVLYQASKVRFVEVTDGLSGTLMIGERPPGIDDERSVRFGWWYAGVGQMLTGSADSHLCLRETNVSFRHPSCPRGPYHYSSGNVENPCDTFHFWSLHPGGAHFAFCDGSVRFLAYSADPIMPALATRAGGEAVTFE